MAGSVGTAADPIASWNLVVVASVQTETVGSMTVKGCVFTLS
jgi:hypothetical protein